MLWYTCAVAVIVFLIWRFVCYSLSTASNEPSEGFDGRIRYRNRSNDCSTKVYDLKTSLIRRLKAKLCDNWCHDTHVLLLWYFFLMWRFVFCSLPTVSNELFKESDGCIRYRNRSNDCSTKEYNHKTSLIWRLKAKLWDNWYYDTHVLLLWYFFLMWRFVCCSLSTVSKEPFEGSNGRIRYRNWSNEYSTKEYDLEASLIWRLEAKLWDNWCYDVHVLLL